MTDRIRHLTITLDRDVRDDDCEVIIAALRMIKGVDSVTPHVTDSGDWLAKLSVQADLRRDLHQTIRDFFEKQGG